MIRPATAADLEALLAIESRFPGDRLSRRAFRHHLFSPCAVVLVDESDGGLAGYALLLRRSDSRWWRLYSLARAVGAPSGTGGRLLEAAIEVARAAQAAGIRLEVRADNTAALRLYERRGFRLFETRDGYYEDGAPALRLALALAA
jgi:ribosomal protein S18 acetylase RimI-like enzyme